MLLVLWPNLKVKQSQEPITKVKIRLTLKKVQIANEKINK